MGRIAAVKKTPSSISTLTKMTLPIVCLVAIGALAIRETSKILSGESEDISNQIPDIVVFGGCLVVLAIVIALPSARLRIITMVGLLALGAALIYLKSVLPI